MSGGARETWVKMLRTSSVRTADTRIRFQTVRRLRDSSLMIGRASLLSSLFLQVIDLATLGCARRCSRPDASPRGRPLRRSPSRDSRFAQRNGHALLVEVVDGVVDGLVECCDIGEGLMGEVMRLEVAPDGFDVVEFGSVFGQPLDGEPVRPRREGRERELADMDRPIVLDQHDRFCRPARLGASVMSRR